MTEPAPVAAEPARRASARSRGVVLLVLALGAVLLLVASSQDWFHAAYSTGVSAQEKSYSGSAGSAVRAIGLLLLAAVPATLATRARMRPVLGGLLTLISIGTLAIVLGRGTPTSDTVPSAALDLRITGTSWPHLAELGAVVALLGSLGVAILGRRWSEMGKRYERTDREAAIEDPWSAMERGIDPTADDLQH